MKKSVTIGSLCKVKVEYTACSWSNSYWFGSLIFSSNVLEINLNRAWESHMIKNYTNEVNKSKNAIFSREDIVYFL